MSMNPNDLAEWLRAYAADRINSATIDERRCLPPYIVLDFGNRGILGMLAERAYGGLGYGHADACVVLEQLGAIDTTLCLFVALNNYLGVRPISRFANAETKAELMPNLAAGRELAAFALTEPGAGSNARGIESRAEPDGPDQWCLYGTKQWIGSAQWASVINVFVREGKTHAVGGHIVRQGAAGLRLGPEAPTMGMRGMIQNTIYLEGARTQRRDRLGRDGEGMSVAQDAMTHARLAIGAMCHGAIQRCAQLALRYTSKRQVSTGLLLNNPTTLAKLSRMTASATALACLVSRIAQAADSGANVPMEGFVACKVAAPEFLWRAADDLVQLVGGRGYMENTPIPQLLRDARVFRIFEGPTETMEAFLGARLMAGSSGLGHLLGDTLGARHLVPQLDKLAQLVQEHSQQLREPLASASIHWGQARAGRLATWLILKAAVEGQQDASNLAELRRTALWVEANLETELRFLARGAPEDAAYLGSAELRDQIEAFSSRIGDVEQSLPPMENGIEPLLRRDPAARPAVAARVPASERPGASPVNEAREDELRKVKHWIVEWLSVRLKMPPIDIETSRSFADHGLDSMLGLELTLDLGKWLGVELSETLLWDAATVDALALAALQLRSGARLQPASAADTAAPEQPGLEDELDRLEHELSLRKSR